MLFLALIFVLSSPQGWSLDRHYTIGSRSSVTAFLSSSLEESNTTVARAYVLRDIFFFSIRVVATRRTRGTGSCSSPEALALDLK